MSVSRPDTGRKIIMDKTIVKRLGTLLSVKSLVTLVLTAVFAIMALKGTISQDFMTVYAVVIAFYFGTQSQKVQDMVDSAADVPNVRAESPAKAVGFERESKNSPNI